MAGAIRATVHYHGILCCFKLRAHDIRKACMRIYISARVCVWSTVHMDAIDHEERARGRACKHSIAAFSAVRGDVQPPRRSCERERKVYANANGSSRSCLLCTGGRRRSKLLEMS